MQYGYEALARDAKKSGVDGLIIPDLPLEEGREAQPIMAKHGLHVIYLLAPTSTSDRKLKIARASRGFIYYVSITGVTGMRREIPKEIFKDISLVKRLTRTPVCVGFGISEPQQAQALAKVADGVIVGSALVQYIHTHPHDAARRISKNFIQPFAKGLRKNA
jgi:tryptophan synthase alpha chain